MESQKKQCKKCREQIDRKAKKCPHCGANQGAPGCLIVLGVLIFIIIIVAVAGGDNNTSSSKDNPKGTNNTTKEKFTLLEHSVSDESNNFAMYIEGKVQNNKNKDYNYVSITFTTYDADGNTIGTCLDNNSGLQANGTWKFKAICTENVDEIDHYELKEITGW